MGDAKQHKCIEMLQVIWGYLRYKTTPILGQAWSWKTIPSPTGWKIFSQRQHVDLLEEEQTNKPNCFDTTVPEQSFKTIIYNT